MQFLEPHDFPTELLYHRKTSPQYCTYLEGCGLKLFPQENTCNRLWGKKLFGLPGLWLFNSERTDVEPDIDKLKEQSGAKHGIVIWVPYKHNLETPKNWRKLLLPTHFQETGYTVAEEWYEKKWSQRARRAKKRFLRSGAILQAVERDVFIQAFQKAKFLPILKWAYITYYKKLTAIDPKSVRQWLVYTPEGRPVAWLAVHDFSENQSVHMVAFTTKEAYPYQAGTGLIDAWFADSVEKGIKYISLDQLRQKHGPRDQKGYSEFKENFIEYRLHLPKSYFRVF